MGHWRRRRPRWLEFLGYNKERLEHFVKWRTWGLSVIALFGLACIILLQGEAEPQQSKNLFLESRSIGRRLLEDNTTESSLCEFEQTHIPEAWIFNHCLFILIIFIALAIICDDFFVPSLEIISEKLNLSEDVAGATFMAAGSSAPELFTSVAAVIQGTDVGVGTIVGSAVFNLLIIIALTAALAGQILVLDWRPLMRDSFFYAMSIGCFIGFAWDGYFTHYESAILLSLYILYLVLMVFNPKILEWMGTWKVCCKTEVSPANEDDAEKAKTDSQTQLNHKGSDSHLHANGKERRPSFTGGHARRISIINRERAHSEERIFHHKRGSIAGVLQSGLSLKKSHIPHGDSIKEENVDSEQKEEPEEEEEEEEEGVLNICPCCPCCPKVRTHPPSAETARAEGGCWPWTKFIIRWIIFIPAFPFVCLFSWTIPDCSTERLKKYYAMSFVISVSWIAALSFAMVTLVERTGCILNIDTYIMGLVIVAIGTSIPDALSSILVARDGYGDMAVSNAIGSNVFDINLGLGLPFIIRIVIDKGAPISLLEQFEWVDYFNGKMSMIPHAKFGFLLLLILLLAIIVFFGARFRLTKFIGITFVTIYFCFMAYAFTQELYCRRKLDIYC